MTDIPPTTDQRLLDHNTTEFSCECPGTLYRTDRHRCPWTGDMICRHIYRFRLRERYRAKREQCLALKAEAVAMAEELAKEPPPKKRKKQAAAC